MKILFVSDRVVNRLYSPNVAEHYKGIELIVGCGDLPYYYLEYIECMLNMRPHIEVDALCSGFLRGHKYIFVVF